MFIVKNKMDKCFAGGSDRKCGRTNGISDTQYNNRKDSCENENAGADAKYFRIQFTDHDLPAEAPCAVQVHKSQ